MNEKVIISPYAKSMRNGKPHPKNYPYWADVIYKCEGLDIDFIQIGKSGDPEIEGISYFKRDLSLLKIRDLIKECDTWMSVDSFLPHLNHFYDRKPGIVLFSQSDPKMFGYEENLNLYKDVKYFRERQAWMWEQADYIEDAFVSVEEVFDYLMNLLEPK